jgi:hypothetical protein
MIEMDAQSRKNILASVFRRRKGGGDYTALFDDLDVEKQNILLNAINFGSTELPIIGGVDNSDNWFFLTTERVVWKVDGNQEELSNHSIVGASSDIDAIRLGGPQVKADRQRLEVVTESGRKYFMRVESGAPYFVILQILINLARRNRARKKRKERGA